MRHEAIPHPHTPAASRPQRLDGWTPERRRAFLEAIAEGHSVGSACKLVGLSSASAYALRHRVDGAEFALGWQAAMLVARAHVADTLLARALDGQVDTYRKADGTQVTRHRHDNRLAMQLLARLDRYAEANTGTAADHAARTVAQDFHAFLDGIERDDGPARAALFLVTRDTLAEAPDLAAIAALSRADHYLRTGAGTARDLDIADLDPARRAEWSAGQWARAEAAGLVALAPAPAPEESRDGDSQLSQPDEIDPPVWWDDEERDWRTRFPPPDGYDGEEAGLFGDDLYERTLTPEEAAAVDAEEARAVAALSASGAVLRDRWFDECRQRGSGGQGGGGGGGASYSGAQRPSSTAHCLGGSQTCAPIVALPA